MFTRRHYIAVADILKEAIHLQPYQIAERFACFFEKDNPRFDCQKWFEYLSDPYNDLKEAG